MKPFRFGKAVPILLSALLLVSCSARSKSADNATADIAYDSGYSGGSAKNGGFNTYSRSEMYAEGTEETYFDSDFFAEAEESPLMKQEDAGAEKPTVDGRKIIYTSWYEISTQEYDASLKKLNELCDALGAYFESAESYGDGTYANRSASYTIRIPSEKYQEFIRSTGTLGTVTASGENNRDVTEQYFDTQARLESAQLREERLLDILAKADSLDDVLLLERELSDVRYEIESYTGELKKFDSLVNYSTATLHLSEVKKVVEPDSEKQTLGKRMSLSLNRGFDAFRETLAAFAVDVAYSLPVLLFIWLPLLIVAALVILLLRRRHKKRREARRPSGTVPPPPPSAGNDPDKTSR